MHIDTIKILQAISWTLIHSLWQGALLAAAAGLVIIVTKRASSFIRYQCLAVLFLLFLVTAAFTFCRQLDKMPANNSLTTTLLPDTPQTLPVSSSQGITNFSEGAPLVTKFVHYANEHALLIVGAWFFIFSIRFVKLVGGIGYSYRVRYFKTQGVDDYWRLRLQELADRLHIKRKVVLLQSGLIQVPVMTGFLKPAILFPFGLLLQLPPDEVEAVLLHELAHIKRRDYMVNLLQTAGEVLFFFNPGVLWLSALIRDERENCCDDIAIMQTRNKKDFVSALLFFQEYKNTTSKMTMSFPGQKNHLLNRIKRIITNNNKTLNTMEKISLTGAILLTGMLTIAFRHVQPEPVKKQASPNKVRAMSQLRDTVPTIGEIKEGRSAVTVNSTIDGKEYRLEEVNHKTKAFYVDGKQIPADKLGEYQEVIDKIHKELEENQAKVKSQNDLLQKQNLDMQQLQEIQQEKGKKQMELETELMILQLKKNQDEVNHKMEEWKNDQKHLSADLVFPPDPPALLQLEKQKQEILEQTLKLQATQNKLLNEKLLLQLNNHETRELLLKEQTKLFLQQKILEQKLKLDPPTLHTDLLLNETVNTPLIPTEPIEPLEPISLDLKSGEPVGSIIDDLLNERLITNTDELSFTLNSKTLKVNGVTQPKEIQSRFSEKYIKGKGDHVIYSTSHGNTHADVYSNR